MAKILSYEAYRDYLGYKRKIAEAKEYFPPTALKLGFFVRDGRTLPCPSIYELEYLKADAEKHLVLSDED